MEAILMAKALFPGKSGQTRLDLLRKQYCYMSLSLFVRKAVISWALALGLPSLLSAQITFTNNGPEYAIAGAQPGDQAHPTAALCPLGGFLAWEDNAIDGFGLGIGALALDSNFGAVGRPFRVNQIVGGDQSLPQIALIPGGGGVFAWQGGAPSRQNIYARFLSPTNTWLTGDVMVNTFTANFRRQPALAVLPNGNVVFAWGSYNQYNSSSYQDIYAQILTSAGAKVGSEFLVNQFTPYNQRTPAIAALSTGGFVIVWVSEQQTQAAPQNADANFVYSPNALPSVDIFARTFDSNGVALANEFIVNTNTSPCNLPAVAAGPNGGFIVSWTEKNLVVPANSLDVFSRTFSTVTNGGPVRMVNTYTLGDQYASQIASVGANYLVVWTSMGQDGSWEGVYGQFLNQDGSASGCEFRLNTTTVGRQMHGTVISDNTERFLALWTSFGSLASGFDLYAQLVAPGGYVPSAPISKVFAAPASDPFPIVLPPLANPLPPLAPSGSNNTSVAAQPGPTLDPLPPLLPLSGNAPSNAIAQAQGAYNGLIYNTNVTVATAGFFTAKTTAKGAYSGSLLIAGRNHGISGKFSPLTGLATNTFRMASGQFTVRLRLDLSGTDRLEGVITDSLSNYVAQLDADRLVFSAKTNPAPQQGSYTMAIPADSSGPAGYGYGTMTVSAGGVVKWSGTLADGTKVNQSSAVSKDGLWPLYCSIYGGGGGVISWMQFNTNLPASDVSGQPFIWIKPAGLSAQSFPAGFTNSVEAVGAAFTAPNGRAILDLTNLDLIFSGGGLTNAFTNSFTLDPHNRVTAARADRLKLTFSTSSGLFKGSTLNPETGKSFSFEGVVYEKAANGAGLFLTSDKSGQVYSGQVYLGGAPPSSQ
jgi:hypothetical protein